MNNKYPKEAIILAGGLGTRLRSVVDDLPKPMASINGVPFLEILIRHWKEKGIKRFVLSIGYLGHKIEQYFGSCYDGVIIEYINEKELLGTGGAIHHVLQVCWWENDEVIVLNGDTWFNVDIFKLLEDYSETKKPITICLKELTHNDRYSSVEIAENNLVKSFEMNNGGRGFINAGCYLIQTSNISPMMAEFPPKFSFENDFMPNAVTGRQVAGSIHTGDFIDIGIPSDYEYAQKYLSYIKN